MSIQNQQQNDATGINDKNRDDAARVNPENERDARSINQDVGLRVRERRKARRLSQEALCSAAGGIISRPFLAELERGEKKWTVEQVQAMAAALGVEVRELLPGPDDGEGETRRGNPGPELSADEAALVEAVRATGAGQAQAAIMEAVGRGDAVSAAAAAVSAALAVRGAKGGEP